jgi:CDP-diacylglycerol--glycerol-3-phosphate 3-phosphatidyltransferase
MNWPNGLTVARLALGPAVLVAVLAGRPGAALALFVLAMLSDLSDGYLARRLASVTEFGRFMDPLADKVVVSLALLALVGAGAPLVPVWMVVVIIGRELLVLGYRIAFRAQGLGFETTRAAKAKTLIQMIWIAVVLLHAVVVPHGGPWRASAAGRAIAVAAWVFGFAAVALTVTTGVEYFVTPRRAASSGHAATQRSQGRGSD